MRRSQVAAHRALTEDGGGPLPSVVLRRWRRRHRRHQLCRLADQWRYEMLDIGEIVSPLDFRMSTTCVYSDSVLPTATWYEKNDLNTSDMHHFIHPLTGAVDPVWEARSDWEIYKAIAKKFSKARRKVIAVASCHPSSARARFDRIDSV